MRRRPNGTDDAGSTAGSRLDSCRRGHPLAPPSTRGFVRRRVFRCRVARRRARRGPPRPRPPRRAPPRGGGRGGEAPRRGRRLRLPARRHARCPAVHPRGGHRRARARALDPRPQPARRHRDVRQGGRRPPDGRHRRLRSRRLVPARGGPRPVRDRGRPPLACRRATRRGRRGVRRTRDVLAPPGRVHRPADRPRPRPRRARRARDGQRPAHRRARPLPPGGRAPGARRALAARARHPHLRRAGPGGGRPVHDRRGAPARERRRGPDRHRRP